MTQNQKLVVWALNKREAYMSDYRRELGIAVPVSKNHVYCLISRLVKQGIIKYELRGAKIKLSVTKHGYNLRRQIV